MVPLFLHVLPLDVARGAQRYARAMRERLDGDGAHHRTLTIFRSSQGALDADIRLDVSHSPLAKRGFEPRAPIALGRALRELRPRAVVAHGGQSLKYLALAAPPAMPLIYYKIGIVPPAAHRPLRVAFQSLLLRRPQFVAAVSERCLEEARDSFGVPQSKLVLIPNGRDPDQFQPRTNRSRERSPRMIFVGHLTASKRPELFLDVAKMLRTRGIPFDAWMVGSGPLEASVRARAGESGVEVLGHRDDVPALLRESDILVFTSVPEGEGMPGVFIEAGLSGLPVVATDVPGARDVVKEGVTGYVTGVDDVSALVDRVANLLLDPGLRVRLGASARDRCASEFSLERSSDLWATLLRGTGS